MERWKRSGGASEGVKVEGSKRKRSWAGRRKLSWWEGTFGQISSFLKNRNVRASRALHTIRLHGFQTFSHRALCLIEDLLGAPTDRPGQMDPPVGGVGAHLFPPAPPWFLRALRNTPKLTHIRPFMLHMGTARPEGFSLMRS